MTDTPPCLIPVEESIRAVLAKVLDKPESIRAVLAKVPDEPGQARDYCTMCILLGVGRVLRNEIMRVLPEISEDQFAIIGEVTAQHLEGILKGSLHSLQARMAFGSADTETMTEEVVE